VKQEKSQKGKRILAGLTLVAFLSPLAGCGSSIVSKPLEDVQQLPTSQATSEIRTTAPYILDVGDEVNIKVWGFDELQKTVTINNSGDIYYPMLGRLRLAGKTIPQTQEMLTARLKQYLVDPQVDVTSTTGQQQVYVLGEVTNAGTLSYTRPLRVTEALARAGWFNNAANKSNVLLVRRAHDRFHVYRINAEKVLQNGSPAPQVFLQSGDLIYVPPRTIVNIGRFMTDVQSILQPFITAEQMIVLWPAFKNALKGGGTGLSISTPTSAPATTTSQ